MVNNDIAPLPIADIFDVSGQRALVTGSSRGIGRELATALSAAGATAVVHGTNSEAAAATATEIAKVTDGDVRSVAFDLRDAAATGQGVRDVLADLGGIDILVNNAGIQRRHPIAGFPDSELAEIVDINLVSVMRVTSLVAPSMISAGHGKIVNVGSIQSLLARPTIAPYTATKGGVSLFTKGLAADLGRHGVQANCLAPGYIATEMNRALLEDEAFNEWVVNRTPANRWGSTRDLVGTLLYLCAPASNYVNGQTIFVDGGMSAVV